MFLLILSQMKRFFNFTTLTQMNYIAYQMKQKMPYPTQQDVIKRKLHSFDMQQSQNMAAQLSGTYHSNHFSLPKHHSFREISDWNDRYPIDKPLIYHQQSQQAEKHNQLPEFYRYAFLIYPEKRGNLKQTHSVSLKKQKCYLSPLKMEFLNGNTKKRLKKQTSLFNNEEAQGAKKLKYELNYEPLKKLYWLKTKKEAQKVEKSHKQLPILLPAKDQSMKLPKTERSSSILRVMKKNQKIREIRKNKNPQSSQLNMFIINA